jgi:hypothetical protein
MRMQIAGLAEDLGRRWVAVKVCHPTLSDLQFPTVLLEWFVRVTPIRFYMSKTLELGGSPHST